MGDADKKGWAFCRGQTSDEGHCERGPAGGALPVVVVVVVVVAAAVVVVAPLGALLLLHCLHLA